MNHRYLLFIATLSSYQLIGSTKFPTAAKKSQTPPFVSPPGRMSPVKSISQLPSKALQTMQASLQSFLNFFIQSKDTRSQAFEKLQSIRTESLSDPVLQQKINSVINNLEQLDALTQKKDSTIPTHLEIKLDTNQAFDALNDLTTYLTKSSLPKAKKEEILSLFERKIDTHLTNFIKIKEPQSSLFLDSVAPKKPSIPRAKNIKTSIFAISQSQVDSLGNGFIPATGQIETPKKYIDNLKKYLQQQLIREHKTETSKYLATMDQNLTIFLKKKYQEENPIVSQKFTEWTVEQQNAFNLWKENPELQAVMRKFKKDYTIEHPVPNKITIESLRDKLQDYEYVIDSRGDGNCGYRAVLVSLYMQSIGKPENFRHLENLVTNNFERLFREYNNPAVSNIQDITNLKVEVLKKLQTLAECQSVACIQKHIQKDTAFDYAMIMFERYMMVDFIKTRGTEDQKMILTAVAQADNLDVALAPMLDWRQLLDQDTTNFLAQAMQIQINTVDRNSNTAIQKIYPETVRGRADILYVPGHYQILVPTPPTSLEQLS